MSLATFLTILVFAVILLISLVLQALALQMGARWTRSQAISFRWALTVIIATSVISHVVLFGIVLTQLSNGPTIAALAGLCLVDILLIARMMKTTFWRAAGSISVVVGANLLLVGLMAVTFKPFVCEAFVIPTNSMAPTLLGSHWTGTCPRCGSPAFCSPFREEEARFAPDEVPMICSREMKQCKVLNPPRKAGRMDRCLVNKLLSPQRWDLVVFRYPADPKTLFVKRLVGMPGEEIRIRDGAVWANGIRLTPPAEVGPLYFVDQMEGFLPGERLWGCGERPATLGSDEFFVLGDNSPNAMDSRLWRVGAEGHPPYAVPLDHLVGVVTHLYWPIPRMRAFR